MNAAAKKQILQEEARRLELSDKGSARQLELRIIDWYDESIMFCNVAQNFTESENLKNEKAALLARLT